MDNLPFAASFDALAHIVKVIREAAAVPEVAEMVPALGLCFNSCSWEEEKKKIIDHIPYEHYMDGWYRIEEIADAVQLEILGRRVFIDPDTLKRLAGKRLVVGCVKSSSSSAVNGKRQILFARPETRANLPTV